MLAGHMFDMLDIAGDEVEGGRGQGELSREELRMAFVGMPQLHDHSIEEFLYLFRLNHEGNITRVDSIRESQDLGVLSHPVDTGV